LSNIDFSNLFIIIKEETIPGPISTLADAQKAGMITINYGTFLATVVSFLIVAFTLNFIPFCWPPDGRITCFLTIINLIGI